ncbi:MAG: hypothetical protein KKD69_01500 [Euryarchaeota archaeon]|nr:hypothetical protein [Euryarchaeota archaeon]MCG2728470.1 hypothetical protein [Candidatus Methanoperedenaceae archaeon]
MKLAIFHDYIGAIGGGEKLVLMLARGLGVDVITTDVDADSIKKMGFEDAKIISLGGTIKLPPLKWISASLRFALCDFSMDCDFFIFSGNWAHYAARRHKPNFLANLQTASTSAGKAMERTACCGSHNIKI